MPLLKDNAEKEKEIYEGDSVEEITENMRERNAERLGVTEEELEQMPYSEIRARVQQKKEEESSPWWKFW